MAKATSTTRSSRITSVKIRMYCMGTGDCFVLKYYAGAKEKYTMMIDCGSCQGGPAEFLPYLQNLSDYVGGKLDLLVITHEHNDHVNGFAKCPEIFEAMTIKKAWFAWTENPADPEDRADDLQKRRKKMRVAFANALTINKNKQQWLHQYSNGVYEQEAISRNHTEFVKGLQTLADINLPTSGSAGSPLPGMIKIKAILKKKKTKVEYLNPGTTLTIPELNGLKFHVLGPPYGSKAIYKEGKQGSDVYKKKLAMNDRSLAVNSFENIEDEPTSKDIPFDEEYIVKEKNFYNIVSSITKTNARDSSSSQPVLQAYGSPDNDWRKIDLDWFNSAGSLALRLNSHINNTSLVLAVESEGPGQKVLLLPGDAEFGSWESWHQIKKWDKKGKNDKHLVEDLLNRTVFYKVGHHLSYNGTALEKGIQMMESNDLAAMATLDRKRIASKWKTTMPNKYLLQELITRCKGKLFIMNESDIRKSPSTSLDPTSLGKNVYERKDFSGTKNPIYIQYTCKV